MPTGHDELIRREFTKQARSFEDPTYSFADARLMAWILDNVLVEPGSLVLDVAAGTGHVARAMAEHARQVVAVDLTPKMLATGKEQVDAAGIVNVLYQRGDAAALPHLDDSFDLVVTRFSVHHFEEPALQVNEMARVCRPSGRVAIVDLVIADAETGERHNELERLRDPSHSRALAAEELTGLMESAGVRIVHTTEHDQALDLDRWLAQSNPGPDTSEQIRAALRIELEGGPATGMRPFEKDGALKFHQRWLIAVGEKLA